MNGLLSCSTGKLGVKTAEFTSFCLQLYNDGGTLKHNIVADPTGSVASGYVSKITGASTTLAATPQVAAGVDFTSGAGVEAAGTSVVHFNTAAQVAGEWSGIATVEYNDSGTAMLAGPRRPDLNLQQVECQRFGCSPSRIVGVFGEVDGAWRRVPGLPSDRSAGDP